MEKTAYINVYKENAICEFLSKTSPNLKQKIKDRPELKWRKKMVDGKEHWFLNIDFTTDAGKSVLRDFVLMLRDEDITIKFVSSDGTLYDTPYDPDDQYGLKDILEMKDRREEGTTDVSSAEKTEKHFLYITKSYYQELSKIAQDKHITFSQLVICACEQYIRTEKQAEPLKVLDKPSVSGSFSEQIRIEIARRQSKSAWVADKLGIPRSRFYSMLDSDNWSDPEREAIKKFFGW